MRDGKGFGASWLGPGEHRSTCVSRGWRTCPSERLCVELGPPHFQPAGWAQVGSGGRLLAAVERRTAGH